MPDFNAQGCGGVRRKVGVACTEAKITTRLFQVADARGDVGLSDCRISMAVCTRVHPVPPGHLKRKGVHYGSQHADIVCGDSVHAFSTTMHRARCCPPYHMPTWTPSSVTSGYHRRSPHYFGIDAKGASLLRTLHSVSTVRLYFGAVMNISPIYSS